MNESADNMTEFCYQNGCMSVTGHNDELLPWMYQPCCRSVPLEMRLAQLRHEVSLLQSRLHVAEAQISHLTTTLHTSYLGASVCVNTPPPGLIHPTMRSFARIANQKVQNKRAR